MTELGSEMEPLLRPGPVPLGENRLCRLLEIEHPVISAGMGAISGPELAAAVSNAGGCGQLSLTGADSATALDLIRRTRELTDRPFAVNVILDLHGGEEVETALREAVPAFLFFWGDPAPFVGDARQRGSKVLFQVGSVEEGVAGAEAGVDVIVAQGLEAGGHVRGTTPLVSLLPSMVDAVAVPVVAAGGIVDSRGMAAALSLGGEGVLMGTRFLASNEAFIHDQYQEKILTAGSDDTVYTENLFDVWWPNAPHRMLRNRLVAEWEAAGRPPPGRRSGEGTVIGTREGPGGMSEIPRYASFSATPRFHGDIEQAPLWAGMSVGLVREVKPAGAIVEEVGAGSQRILGTAR